MFESYDLHLYLLDPTSEQNSPPYRAEARWLLQGVHGHLVDRKWSPSVLASVK